MLPCGPSATMWQKYTLSSTVAGKGSQSFYPRDSHEEDVSCIPKHHEVKWFNPVHYRQLGNQPISLTHSEESRQSQESRQGFFTAHSWAQAKTRAPFLGRTGFLVFDAMLINSFGPSVSERSIPEPTMPLSPIASDDCLFLHACLCLVLFISFFLLATS